MSRRRKNGGGLLGLVIVLGIAAAIIGWIQDELASLGITPGQAFAGTAALLVLGIALWMGRRHRAAAEQVRLHQAELGQTMILQRNAAARPAAQTVAKPRPATSRTPGLLASLPATRATITYLDAEGHETTRPISVHHLVGLRDRRGDVLESIEAWCHTRQAPRTFYVRRIKALWVGEGDPVPSPETWLRAQGDLRPITPAIKAPEAELVVLFSRVRIDALIRYREGRKTQDLTFRVEELLALETGGIKKLCGSVVATGERRTLSIEGVLQIADAYTGEIAQARRQWLKDRAAESVAAGIGHLVHEPVKARRKKRPIDNPASEGQ